MRRKEYVLFTVATGLLKAAVLAVIVFWLLPLLGISIPVWGIVLLIVVFVIYEVWSFRLSRRALEKKSTILPPAGCCGRAVTPLTPNGYVQVQGELWRAVSNDMNISEGDDIVVVEVNRFTLRVTQLTVTRIEALMKSDTKSM